MMLLKQNVFLPSCSPINKQILHRNSLSQWWNRAYEYWRDNRVNLWAAVEKSVSLCYYPKCGSRSIEQGKEGNGIQPKTSSRFLNHKVIHNFNLTMRRFYDTVLHWIIRCLIVGSGVPILQPFMFSVWILEISILCIFQFKVGTHLHKKWLLLRNSVLLGTESYIHVDPYTHNTHGVTTVKVNTTWL